MILYIYTFYTYIRIYVYICICTYTYTFANVHEYICEVRVYLYNAVCARNGLVASHIVHLGTIRTTCGAHRTRFKQSCHARFVMLYYTISYSSGHRGYIVLYYFMLRYIILCYTMSYYIMVLYYVIRILLLLGRFQFIHEVMEIISKFRLL